MDGKNTQRVDLVRCQVAFQKSITAPAHFKINRENGEKKQGFRRNAA